MIPNHPAVDFPTPPITPPIPNLHTHIKLTSWLSFPHDQHPVLVALSPAPVGTPDQSPFTYNFNSRPLSLAFHNPKSSPPRKATLRIPNNPARSVTGSTSLRSSILDHAYVNGRRYHRYRHGRYPIPNDEAEQNREDMLHTMMMESTDGRLFYAPIGTNPQKVIDLGTGTGLWAIEFGDRYPSAEVTGLDLSPIQPAWVPPNVKFLVDDVEAEWLNGDDFDFVHLRNMIPILKSPVDLLKQVYDNLKPGGWVELQDVDGRVHTDDDSVPADWPLKRLTELLVDAFAQFGTNASAAEFGRQYLEEAGFVNIQHNYIKLPYGTWPKDKLMRLVGMYYRTACEDFLPAVGAIHFPRMGWQQAEMEVFFAEVRLSMRDPAVHAYGKMHFWSGQKPLDF
ncbi:hypothetical protein NQ176_g8856 [Zarea fungicola]|uniref:Uncharacterized protein n=1 Tax=Zarea fungicola TaxID=93591 RepID=A0ACC1MQX8_9HYPO|nr:hypothetical protein NQ176_g8856 [Lecanicillium fungicola]